MATDDGTYIFAQLEADEDAIHAQSMARLAELEPTWSENATSIESLMSRAQAANAAMYVDLATDVEATIAAQVGNVAGIPRDTPRPAVAEITVVTDGAESYVLPAGATVVGRLPDQTAVAFFTIEDLAIPEGTTTVTGVRAQAYDDGLIEPLNPGPLEPDQAYAWLESVHLTGMVFLGQDDMADADYLDRVSRRLKLLADRPILPEDFQALAEDMPGVGRALAINLLDATNPAAPITGVPRCVTVVVAGPDGTVPTNALLTAVRDDLEARREVNFRVFVVAPTYLPLAIELTVAAWPDHLATAGQAVEAQLRQWLHPAVFGGRGSHGTAELEWQQTSTVRVGEVLATADLASGVDYISPGDVLINGANADAVLSAPIAALPDPDATAITVHVVERQP